MENKRPMKVPSEFYNFIKKFGVNRIKSDTDDRMLYFCELQSLIVKYFKMHNERYLELVNMEVKDGNK